MKFVDKATAGVTGVVKATVLILASILLVSMAQSNTSQAFAAEDGQTVWYTKYQKDGEYSLVVQDAATPLESQGEVIDQEEVALKDHMRILDEESPVDNAIKHISFSGDIKAPQSMRKCFSGCRAVETINLEGLDTSQVTDMGLMFYGCLALQSLDLSPLDTSRVTNMTHMFYECPKLQSLDLRGLDTSQVTDMQQMFAFCRGLTSLYLSPLGGAVDEFGDCNMVGMFRFCSSLTSIDLSPLDTSCARHLNDMFESCSSLTSIDLSPLDTSQVYYMDRMFEGCSSLTSIDLSPFDTSHLVAASRMFAYCSSLTSLDLSPLDLSKVEMFNKEDLVCGCDNLTAVTLRKNCEIPISGLSTVRWASGKDPYYDYGWEPGLPICESSDSAVVAIQGETVINAVGEGHCQLKFTYPQDDFEASTSSLNVVVKDVVPADSNPPVPDSEPSAPSTKPPVPSPSRPEPAKPDTQNPTPGMPQPPAATNRPPAAKLSLAKAAVTVKPCVWSGKRLVPVSVTVKLGGKTLRKSADYAVSCKGGKAVGSYKVIITGKGSYTGAKTAEFKIVPKAVTGAKAKGAKRAVEVSWKKPRKAARAQVTGYEVRCSVSKSMKGAAVTKVKGASKTSLTVKKLKAGKKSAKLKAGKKYYVQVRAYKIVKGKTYYSAWSSVKSAKTKR